MPKKKASLFEVKLDGAERAGTFTTLLDVEVFNRIDKLISDINMQAINDNYNAMEHEGADPTETEEFKDYYEKMKKELKPEEAENLDPAKTEEFKDYYRELYKKYRVKGVMNDANVDKVNKLLKEKKQEMRKEKRDNATKFNRLMREKKKEIKRSAINKRPKKITRRTVVETLLKEFVDNKEFKEALLKYATQSSK